MISAAPSASAAPSRRPPLILASASPRRAELLTQMGLKFQVLPGHAEEVEHEHLSPGELAQLNAYRKARLIAKQHPDALVLGADTVVCLGLKLYAKPASLDDARRMLAELQGQTHDVVTGVCLIHLRAHAVRLFAESAQVTFRPLDAAAINEYLSRINPLDKAGGYAVQEHGDLIIQQVEGPVSTVIGLPVERLQQELNLAFPAA